MTPLHTRVNGGPGASRFCGQSSCGGGAETLVPRVPAQGGTCVRPGREGRRRDARQAVTQSGCVQAWELLPLSPGHAGAWGQVEGQPGP